MYDSKEYHHRYYVEHKEHILKRQREWYRENHERVLAHQRQYSHAHREQDRTWHKEWRSKHRDHFNYTRRLLDAKIRLRILRHYSPNLACAACGYRDIRALSLDHINRNGREMRARLGSHERQWIIKNNFPEGYQVLCMNCQFIKDKKYAPALEELVMRELVT